MPIPAPVLVATDLTPDAEPALVRGLAHARSIGAPLVVCHVVPDVMRAHPLMPAPHDSDTERTATLVERAAELVTEQVGRVLHVSADEYTVAVESGNAEDEIVRCAEEQKAVLVVVGAKPRSGAERLLGHVAERVVRYAHTPVLVARPGHPKRRILVATDFTPCSLSAVRFAADVMKAAEVGGTLLHVHRTPITVLADPLSPKSSFAELENAGKKRVAELAAEHGFAAAEQIEGDPASVIVRRAEELDVEMIMMGSRGRTGLVRLVLGSTAEKVIRSSHCSVLVTR